jgi:PmbA protein
MSKAPDFSSLEKIAQQVLTLAKKGGATQAEVNVGTGSGLHAAVRLGEVESLEYNRDQGLSVTVYFGKRKGSASTTDTSDNALLQTVASACKIARYTQEDEHSGLADAADMATDLPDLDLYHPWNLQADNAVELARECEAKALTNKGISNSEGAAVDSYEGQRTYANSHGFMCSVPSSRHSISCTLIAEKDGQMQRDYGYTVSRDWQDLDSTDYVATEAVKRTLAKLDAKKIKTTTAPVIFYKDVATGIIGSLLGAINGNNLYRQSSFLVDSLGEQLFPEFMNIVDDPFIKKGLGSAPCDPEGVTAQKKHLIKNGVLETYLLGSVDARKLGMHTTANAGGANNVIVSDTGVSFEALLADMDTGFLVSSVIGQGVNMVTGDYSRGANGFWVEGGKIVHAVEEVTIAANLKDMYQGIRAIANDTENRGSVFVGSILINEMKIAGK